MKYSEANKKAWDQRTAVHMKSAFYDVAGFKAGKTSLQEIELAELTQVEGKKLLHLQCHFGLDTLSWARKGAQVTGVDFSSTAITSAKMLSDNLGIEAEFICSDVYQYDNFCKNKKFDIVYTSYGALCWLPCLKKWAETVANCLKPGGQFYMVEFHPVNYFLEGDSYFHQTAPLMSSEGTYTENACSEESEMFTWSHPLSEVINALSNEGLSITRLNEFAFSPYDCFDGLVEKQAGRYYKFFGDKETPVVYSLSASKGE
ncbi:MAG: class I SAM-dependent methyltransferase [Enterobacterales bacterium]|nr:class I SAM-dependent methyltransferase [Enterobacterales bacterium]